ncbi:hypothetical protein Daura_37660 [Dactylosporangium aurantiacum]|uniref:Uncharacterized protein n=1 Tax=Dactylosporangium aurantiacum TaxID=35754 RepID=A0A9Q9MH70_9ACTN|nr:hypothetical protein [Dactylosporangium aurantiacum]MDG6101854.1 hypothetical protein [Dactylosporangium aurantiacum]UWZ52346.1 hypothetical protein Daura_37660 [Dactylosporangium aurantiacum]
MTGIVAAVYVTAAGDRAALLTGRQLAVLRETVGRLRDRPTVAGDRPDPAALDGLARALDPGDGDRTPVVALPPDAQRWLDLVRRQETIRRHLPLRVRHACTACGEARIEDPARRARTARAAGAGPSGATLVRTAELIDDDEPLLALLNFVADAADAAEAGAAGADGGPGAPCGRCDGDTFDSAPVTFCPSCRAVRDESLLVRCPACGHDFGFDPGGGDPAWTSLPEALAAQRNQVTLRDRFRDFEHGLWPGQADALADAVGGGERLVVMCRCALPTEIGRYVALLLTTARLVWAWETPFSALRSGTVRWSGVRAVRRHGEGRSRPEAGVAVEVDGGEPLVFVDFRGTGVDLGDTPVRCTAEDLFALMTRLHAGA